MPLFQPFVFEGENFVQAETVYLTDVAIFLNRTEKKLYLWAGRRAGREVVEQAQRAWAKFAEKYSDFKITNLITKKDLADFDLAKEIRTLLGQHEDEDIAEKAKSNYNFAAKISCWIGILFLVVVVLQATIMLVFPIQGSLLVISEANFTVVFDTGSILLYFALGLFLTTFIFASLGKNARVSVPSLLAMSVIVGMWFYLAQRDFLFYFQNYGAIPGMIQILATDVTIFIGILALIVLGVCLLFFIAGLTRPKPQASAKLTSASQNALQEEIPLQNST